MQNFKMQVIMWICITVGSQAVFSQGNSALQTHKARGVKLTISNSDQIAPEVARIFSLKFKNADNELRVERSTQDNAGATHIRLRQCYKGVPVEGAFLMRTVVAGDTLLDAGKGATFDNVNVSNVAPRLKKEQAIGICISSYQQSRSTIGIVTALDNAELVIFSNHLAYKIHVHESIAEETWLYIVNADNGEILHAHDEQINATPPSGSGAAAAVHGFRLACENGADSSMTGWKDNAGSTPYFLYYKSGAWGQWGIYSEKIGVDDWVKNATNNWGTTDRFSISAGKNAEWTQNWLKNVLGYNSLDENGILAEVHTYNSNTAKGPRWDGSKLLLTIASGMFNDGAAADIIAHEMGHGVNQFHSGPGGDWTYAYLGCSEHMTQDAQGEAHSDIMGFSVEYYYQPNNLAAYPTTTAGTSDWLIGEDFMANTYLALRDFRGPQRTEFPPHGPAELQQPQCTYYEGTNYWGQVCRLDCNTGLCTGVYDPGPNDCHILACIEDFAFYLLAQGNNVARTNDGHSYGVFSGVGISVAEKIVMYANDVLLNPWSTFQDARNAWRAAAQYFIDLGIAPSNACAISDAAWDAVGVKPELRFGQNGFPSTQIGLDGSLINNTRPLSGGMQTGSLRVINTGTNNGMCFIAPIPTAPNNNIFAQAYSENNAAYLDNANNLLGKLIITAPNGKVQLAVNNAGTVIIRSYIKDFAL
jgi:Zn-dependent metalloprotease